MEDGTIQTSHTTPNNTPSNTNSSNSSSSSSMSFRVVWPTTSTKETPNPITVDQVLNLFAENTAFARSVDHIKNATQRVVMGSQRDLVVQTDPYSLLRDTTVHIKYKCDASNMILEDLTMQGGDYDNLLFSLANYVAGYLVDGGYANLSHHHQQQQQEQPPPYIWSARSDRANGWMSMTKEKRHEKLKERCKLAPTNTTSVLLQVPLLRLLDINRRDEDETMLPENGIINSRACYSGDDASDGRRGFVGQQQQKDSQQRRYCPFDYALADPALEDGGRLIGSSVYCPFHKSGNELNASMVLSKKWTTAYDKDEETKAENIEYIEACLVRGSARPAIEVLDDFSLVSIPPFVTSPPTASDDDEDGSMEAMASVAVVPSGMTDQDKKVEAMFNKSKSFSSTSFRSKLPDTYVRVVCKSNSVVFSNLVYSVAAERLLLLYKLKGFCRSCKEQTLFTPTSLGRAKSVLRERAPIFVRWTK